MIRHIWKSSLSHSTTFKFLKETRKKHPKNKQFRRMGCANFVQMILCSFALLNIDDEVLLLVCNISTKVSRAYHVSLATLKNNTF